MYRTQRAREYNETSSGFPFFRATDETTSSPQSTLTRSCESRNGKWCITSLSGVAHTRASLQRCKHHDSIQVQLGEEKPLQFQDICDKREHCRSILRLKNNRLLYMSTSSHRFAYFSSSGVHLPRRSPGGFCLLLPLIMTPSIVPADPPP